MALTRLVSVRTPTAQFPSVNSLDELRALSPQVDGDAVVIRRAVAGGPYVNHVVYYDAADTSTPDNGYSVFVTADGKRFKDDPSEPINPLLAGFTVTANNLAQCLNTVIQAEVARIIARGAVNGGIRPIKVPHLPNLATVDGVTVYNMTDTVRQPSVLSIVLPEQGLFEWAAFTAGTGWVISNEFTGLTQTLMFRNNGGVTQGASANHPNLALDGRNSMFRGPGYNLTTFPGLRVGNVTYPSGSYAHCRDASVENLRIAGFESGLRLGSVDTYLLRFRGLDLTRNKHALSTATNFTGSVYQWANSGENIRFTECIFGDNYSHAISRNDRGHLITYVGCSFDYNVGDLFNYGSRHIGKDIIIGGHIEGVSGLLANFPVQDAADGQITLKIQLPEYFAARNVRDPYSGIRNLVFGISNRLNVDIDDMSWFHRAPYVNNAYGMVKDLSDPNNRARIKVQYPLAAQSYRYMPGIEYRINNTFTFTGTPGGPLPSSPAGGTFFAIRTGAATVVYGSAADADADGYIPVLITMGATSDTVQLMYNKPLYYGRDVKQLYGKCSIKAGTATGAVGMQTCARVIGSVTRTANLTTGAVTDTEVLAAVPTSASQDILNSLSKGTITITANDYMSTYPVPCSLSGGIYAYMGLRFTGFTGTIAVKLPLWWFSDEHPEQGYL
ncbi:hypothetical protein [Klebsiella phage BUCT86]|uniref:Uncharacterized protein n=1 Tax=Klebsiella phage BUCT86 TaxID=2900302 RepID=A0AAE9C805_9CAUD|nr:hypothetical protein [Klebsiella phage BUCT86]